MDRNTIIGVVLIAGIFILWSTFSNKRAEELREQQQHIQDSIERVEAARMPQQTIDTNGTSLPTTQRTQPGQVPVRATAIQSDSIDLELYTIENDLIKFQVSNKGGRPYSVQLKDYQTHDSLPVILFSGDSTKFGLIFTKGYNSIITNDKIFIGDGISQHVVVEDSPGKLIVTHSIAEKEFLEYTYTLAPNSYQVDLAIRLVGLGEAFSTIPRTLDLEWDIYSISQEHGWTNEAMYSNMIYKPKDEKIEKFSSRSKKDIQLQEFGGDVEWIAYKNQFFSSIIMADQGLVKPRMEVVRMPENGKYIKQYKSVFAVPFSSTMDETIPLSFYFGPNKYKLLKDNYGDKNLKDIVSVGGSLIRIINQGLIIRLFDGLSKWFSNYGLIILLMTIIIKMMLLPLTYRSYKSQAKMRALKPLTDEINAKIPKEKAMERQQATMALYKKAGVSPLGGCLPMVLQMPFLFAMFRFFPASIELRQQSFLWAHDLSTYDSILTLPFTIPMYGNHVSLFTLLMTITTVLSMKTNTQATTSQQMPGMKGMMYMMPIMFMVFLNNYSAALTYYYFLANLITLGQNYLFKQFVDEEALLKKMEARKAKPAKKKSGFQKRLEEAAKQRVGAQPKKKRK